jgi:hypothetical protein
MNGFKEIYICLDHGKSLYETLVCIASKCVVAVLKGIKLVIEMTFDKLQKYYVIFSTLW